VFALYSLVPSDAPSFEGPRGRMRELAPRLSREQVEEALRWAKEWLAQEE
jgi:hypothetical protein